ncbi:hypothetical protein FEK35_23625 [Nocardia cyriacigeorgica]|uniref:Uncharacterized protein n=1 Tax=Nocardia cyriacigeorgica TaxID=135487 RepID=A0A5R8P867_9NOCA|nr:hypothetical protein FEK35_23625 [Nocardia cyriacigeorgica]
MQVAGELAPERLATGKQAAATFFADPMGLAVSVPSGPFVPVQVNDDLTFDFDEDGSRDRGLGVLGREP